MSGFSGMDPTVAAYGQALVYVGQQYGAYPKVTSGLRTWGTQLKLYLKAAAGMSAYPAAAPGTSKHERGLAFDLSTIDDATWLPWLGAVWRSWGGKWYASDPIHFEV